MNLYPYINTFQKRVSLSAAYEPPGVVAGLAIAGSVYAAGCLVICIQLFHHPGQPGVKRDLTT